MLCRHNPTSIHVSYISALSGDNISTNFLIFSHSLLLSVLINLKAIVSSLSPTSEGKFFSCSSRRCWNSSRIDRASSSLWFWIDSSSIKNRGVKDLIFKRLNSWSNISVSTYGGVKIDGLEHPYKSHPLLLIIDLSITSFATFLHLISRLKNGASSFKTCSLIICWTLTEHIKKGYMICIPSLIFPCHL